VRDVSDDMISDFIRDVRECIEDNLGEEIVRIEGDVTFPFALCDVKSLIGKREVGI
jgi:hypothetical protein